MTHRISQIFVCLLFLSVPSALVRAESQEKEYKGINDPFGDPSNYEFSDDEKEDKEFFHLGRFIMLGIDAGAAIFTGGLGKSTGPGFYWGGKLVYFFDRAIGIELAGHYSSHLDQIRILSDPNKGADVDTTIVSLSLGFRYYFDVRGAPKAISAANPYVLIGGGYYMRSQTPAAEDLPSGTSLNYGDTSAFGAFAGLGVEFLVYRKHFYIGLDTRYHFVFFPDENSTLGGAVADGDRSGDYFTSNLTFTYNF